MGDLAFNSMCERVNDIDIPTRIIACEALGQLHFARLDLLRMSLDKQGMNEKDWCAAGAFVIALEDQFMAVRMAAMASLIQIVLARAELAADARALIIDTFNDEAQEVRQLAIEGLHDICAKHRLQFDMSHLESVFCLLDDANPDLRHASRRLLQVLALSDTESVLRTVRCLFAALKKYSADLKSVCECLKAIGEGQSGLVAACVPVLLKIDRFYLMQEPRVEDLYYQLKMLLLYNAAARNPQLAQDLPAYAYKHYTYFRLRFHPFTPSFRRHPASRLFYITPIIDAVDS